MSDDLWHWLLTQIRAGELRGDTGDMFGNAAAEVDPPGRTPALRSSGWARRTSRRGPSPATITTVRRRRRSSFCPERLAFVFAEGDREVRLETKPGDYIFVPLYVPHREENPGGEEAVVIIARSPLFCVAS